MHAGQRAMEAPYVRAKNYNTLIPARLGLIRDAAQRLFGDLAEEYDPILRSATWEFCASVLRHRAGQLSSEFESCHCPEDSHPRVSGAHHS